jgi:hypothetical protein
MSVSTRELRSEVTDGGEFRLTLEGRDVAARGPDEGVVRVEAATINPADLGELLGLADVATHMSESMGDRLVTTAEVPARLLPVGKSLAVGPQGRRRSSEPRVETAKLHARYNQRSFNP